MSSSGIDTLNLKGLSYVGFRLAPFILVSYFVISSVLSSDIKGIIFLALLLLNCFITLIIGNSLPLDESAITSSTKGVCQTLTLTQNGPLLKKSTFKHKYFCIHTWLFSNDNDYIRKGKIGRAKCSNNCDIFLYYCISICLVRLYRGM